MYPAFLFRCARIHACREPVEQLGLRPMREEKHMVNIDAAGKLDFYPRGLKSFHACSHPSPVQADLRAIMTACEDVDSNGEEYEHYVRDEEASGWFVDEKGRFLVCKECGAVRIPRLDDSGGYKMGDWSPFLVVFDVFDEQNTPLRPLVSVLQETYFALQSVSEGSIPRSQLRERAQAACDTINRVLEATL